MLEVHGQTLRAYEIAMKKVTIILDAVAVMAAVLINHVWLEYLAWIEAQQLHRKVY